MRTCGIFLADIALLELLFPQRIRDADRPLTLAHLRTSMIERLPVLTWTSLEQWIPNLEQPLTTVTTPSQPASQPPAATTFLGLVCLFEALFRARIYRAVP